MRTGSAVLLLGIPILLSSPAAAELTVYQGDSITLLDANSTIKWGQDYTFDTSETTLYRDALGIGNDNISVTSNTAATINSTLWEYDLSSVSDGETVLKIGTDAVPDSNVRYEFTGIPAINFGHYTVAVDGSDLKNMSDGGRLVWYYQDWSSHNFTVSYHNVTETNAAPFIKSLSPADVNKNPDSTVELEAEVGDANADQMDLTFYDGNNDQLGEVTDVDNGTYSVTWNDLNPDEEYSWEVEVTDGSKSVVSDTQTFTTIQNQLSWTDQSNNEAGFRIYTDLTGSWKQVKTVDGNTEAFTHFSPDFAFGETVCYNVTAYNRFGESPPLHGCITP